MRMVMQSIIVEFGYAQTWMAGKYRLYIIHQCSGQLAPHNLPNVVFLIITKILQASDHVQYTKGN